MPTRFMNNDGVESGGIFKEENGFLKKTTINNNKNNICKFSTSSSSSSSIGKNSDLSENSTEESGGDGEEEVQSSYHKRALDAMEALEQVLPIRRGISSFYNGKAKSYTSLAYAASFLSSVKDIGKPDDRYTRKRRNQLSRTLHWEDENRASRMRTNGSWSLPMKPKTNTSNDEKRDGECINSGGSSSLSSSESTDILPWISFSVANLQQCTSVSSITCSDLNSIDN